MPDMKKTFGDEIQAMSNIQKALEGLSADEIARVLAWANSKYLKIPPPVSESEGQRDISSGDIGTQPFNHLVDLYDATVPSTNAEKALVAGYWFQVYQEQESFGSQQINNALKDLGHGIGHMPSAFSALENQTPALVRQIKKSGKSQQARKLFKVTDAGIKEVESMIGRKRI